MRANFHARIFAMLLILVLALPFCPSLAEISMASTDPERRDEEESTGAAEDEDTGAQIAPIIKLEEVAVTTGEEEEDALLDLKAKLYRFDKEGNQWKERGHGSIKLLKHKETGKVRIVMRQAKTLKICANHYVFPEIKLQEHAGNEKSCVWHAPDFSDGEVKDEMFAIRFGSVENCKNFMESVEKIAESLGKNDEKESKEATEAAGLLDSLTVSKSKTEEVAPEEATVAAAEKKEKKSETVTD
ncbi:ran-binding protein 1-like protein c-like [Iris pallida]|uniref:Ran-binding protein 1-like protein c-like n=1 Tax=Iris pallida TaxID=29817 RepID=A0AAX6GRA6_IRIPA|nr:ran-binding protein 1-like protein c-like [Iris pallida]